MDSYSLVTRPSYFSMATTTPIAADPVSAEPLPPTGADEALSVNGPLAAARERFVALTVSALRAPIVIAVLTGDDRRCFGAGPALPPWALHDPGAFWRSGVVDLVTQGPIEM